MKKQNSLIVPKPKIEKRIDGIESSLSQMYEDIQTQLADHGEKLELLDILEVHDKRLSTLEVRLDKVIYALEKGNEEFRQFRNEFAKTRINFEQTRQDFEQTRRDFEKTSSNLESTRKDLEKTNTTLAHTNLVQMTQFKILNEYEVRIFALEQTSS